MLSAEVEQQLAEIGSGDVGIGVPTYNNAQTIAGVLEAVRAGVAKFSSEWRTTLIVSDAGSTDDTVELITGADWDGSRLVARHESPPGERVAIPYHGIPGRAAAQRTILEAAERLGVKVCLLMAADCRSITPEWVDRLVRPIVEDECDYVTPLYQRHRYDGTLTNVLVYPLIRALYGKRIRQPMGGQNALSGRLVAQLVAQEVWRADPARQGVDLWMTVTAVTGADRVSEAWLGPCVIESHGRTMDLATTFAQVVGPTFAVLEQTAEAWAGVRGSESVPAQGAPLPLGVEPMELDPGRMVRAFRLGVKDLLPLWEQVMAPETLADVLALGPLPDESFRLSHDLWARVVYDFALGYHFRVLYRDHLLRSLVPLYLGRTAAFIRETTSGGVRETETWIERGCRAFEQQKGYVVERWH